ncbi:PDCD10 and GCKIII kinases-associated protein 1 [Thomomys bottae]
MGCRCCKMIQSYLFDPVQVPSPGYVNEVSSCKLEEDDTVKLKGTLSSEVLVHKNALPDGGLGRTESRGRTSGLPHQGSPLQEDTGGEHCVAINGISPTLQSRNPKPQQGDSGSWTSTAENSHPTQPFLKEDGNRKQDCVLPASEETQVIQNGENRVPSEVESTVSATPDCILQIPAPDYPQLWNPVADNGDHEEKDYLFQNHQEGKPLAGIHLSVGDHGLNLPFPRKRSWDSLNEAVTTEVLNIYFKDNDPVHTMPGVDSRMKKGSSCGSEGDTDEEVEYEDLAVAEALAALEAATAGEDTDEED